MTEELNLNDDKSPLIDLLSCFVCKETMKIEKSAPDRKGHDIIQIVVHAAAESNRYDFFAGLGVQWDEGDNERSC